MRYGPSYTGSTPALGAGRLGSIPSGPKKSFDTKSKGQQVKTCPLELFVKYLLEESTPRGSRFLV